MRRDTWFKCDPTAFLGGIATLEDPLDMLVYTVVLMLIYQAGEPVLNDPRWIGSHCKLSRARTERIIDGLVKIGKLDLIQGRLANGRAQAELERRQGLSTTRSEAGKQGGRPSKSEQNASKTDPKPAGKSSVTGANPDGTGEVSGQETGENRQPSKPNASYARVEREDIREEPPQPPQGGKGDGDGQMPVAVEPLSDADRARLRRQVAGVAERPPTDTEAVARVTGEVMRRAKMTAPPVDLVLVEMWLGRGIDEQLILETVTRLAAGSRGPIRGFRYFDSEIRRQHDAKASADDADIAYFRRIAAERGVEI